ncbi:calcium-binding protein [Paracoccus sp. M683]|uniref:beta strand repeat-containing protein n=1 Tax=Paracoccus sp. M683 TaxID=2594268 RepID=UPI00117F33E9|nr:calcium-binding protein [Paracoccus sp. M683]TRW98362.1 calcium-binding protein [Paracoccus sp. M683]
MATYIGTAGADTLPLGLPNGNDDDDLIQGLAGNDTITGGNGNDTLEGGSGDDVFFIRGSTFGTDIFNGGTGSDVIRLNGHVTVSNLQLTAANVIDIEQLFFSSYNIYGTGGNDTFNVSGIASFGSASLIGLYDGNDSYVGHIGADSVDGGTGNDTLDGGAGNDELTGGGGNDRLIGGSGDDRFYIAGNDVGTDYFNGGTGSDVIRLYGHVTASNLQLTAANVVDVEQLFFSSYNFYGTGGNDTFNFSGIAAFGSASVIGMYDGDDSYVGHIGADSVDGGTGNDTLDGGAGNDELTGGGGDDRLIGGSGDDRFYIAGNDIGTDYFNGGTGSDVIRLYGHVTASNLQLTAANVVGIEQLFFGSYNIYGTGANDTFDFSGIAAFGSASTIQMFDGNDNYLGHAGTDSVDGGTGNDRLNGGAGNDVLTGGNGSDRLYGSTGDDTFLIGGRDFGQDAFFGGLGADQIRLTSNVVVSVLNLSSNRVVGTETLNMSYYSISGTGGADSFNLDGIRRIENARWIEMLDGNDRFTGHSGNDFVDGGAGNDRLIGGAGNDGLRGGTGNDTVDYSAATSGIRVNLGLTTQQGIGGGQGSDTLQDIENVVGSSRGDQLTGSNVANILLGGGGADLLNGGGGGDLLQGGLGSDTATYINATGGVTVRLAVTGAQNVGGGQGSDRLVSIENLTGSSYGDRLEGNNQANTLSGLGGADRLVGGGGNDRLNGGNGNDVLDGGTGNDLLRGQGGSDRLVGGGGADRFEFDLRSGVDRIMDWQDGLDTILLRSGSYRGERYDDFSDLTITQSGANAVVSFGGATIIVNNTQASSLTAADFDFI